MSNRVEQELAASRHAWCPARSGACIWPPCASRLRYGHTRELLPPQRSGHRGSTFDQKSIDTSQTGTNLYILTPAPTGSDSMLKTVYYEFFLCPGYWAQMC
jgi:hypothetical protein